jgi:hypothetical protein
MGTSTDKRIGRLYEGLTPGEKAAAVFASLARLDKVEADRIEATVGLKVYRMLDADFSDRYDRLIRLALLWGVRHWHEFAKVSAAFGLMTYSWDKGDKDLAEEAFEVWVDGQAKMLALDEALDIACQANGLDADAVRTMAETEGPCTTFIEVERDAAYVEEIGELLSKLAR